MSTLRGRRVLNFKSLSFAELQSFLQTWKVPVQGKAKRVTLTTTFDPKHAGARSFARDIWPALKFHNPDTEWVKNKSKTSGTLPELEIELKSGKTKSIPMAEGSAKVLFEHFLDVFERPSKAKK